MSELKVLTYLGNHVNIVNLLGACTVGGERSSSAISTNLSSFSRRFPGDCNLHLIVFIIDWFYLTAIGICLQRLRRKCSRTSMQ